MEITDTQDRITYMMTQRFFFGLVLNFDLSTGVTAWQDKHATGKFEHHRVNYEVTQSGTSDMCCMRASTSRIRSWKLKDDQSKPTTWRQRMSQVSSTQQFFAFLSLQHHRIEMSHSLCFTKCPHSMHYARVGGCSAYANYSPFGGLFWDTGFLQLEPPLRQGA